MLVDILHSCLLEKIFILQIEANVWNLLVTNLYTCGNSSAQKTTLIGFNFLVAGTIHSKFWSFGRKISAKFLLHVSWRTPLKTFVVLMQAVVPPLSLKHSLLLHLSLEKHSINLDEEVGVTLSLQHIFSYVNSCWSIKKNRKTISLLNLSLVISIRIFIRTSSEVI